MLKQIPLAFFALKERFLPLDRVVNSRSGSETWNWFRFVLSTEILKVSFCGGAGTVAGSAVVLRSCVVHLGC